MAYTAVAVAAFAIGGLVISLASHHADKLATVALILAIIAFCLQIGFFGVQLWVAAEQDRRSGQLLRETQAALSDINARTTQTVEVIEKQFAFVLEHALAERSGPDQTPGSTSAENGVEEVDLSLVPAEPGRAEGADPPVEDENQAAIQRQQELLATMEKQLEDVQKMLRANQRGNVVQQWEQVSRPETSVLQNAIQAAADSQKKRFKSFPERDEGLVAFEKLGELTDPARNHFKKLAELFDQNALSGTRSPGISVTQSEETADELAQAGLVTKQIFRHEDGRLEPFVALTPLGISAVRLLRAKGTVPQWYADEAAKHPWATDGSDNGSDDEN